MMQQRLVDTHQFLALPESLIVDTRLRLKQPPAEIRPQQVEHPGQGGGAAAMHSQNKNQCLAAHFRWFVRQAAGVPVARAA